MHHFFTETTGESPDAEREALIADLVHFRAECKRCRCDDKGNDQGGVAGLMMREKAKLFKLMHD
jgi:hypothetical protein